MVAFCAVFVNPLVVSVCCMLVVVRGCCSLAVVSGCLLLVVSGGCGGCNCFAVVAGHYRLLVVS